MLQTQEMRLEQLISASTIEAHNAQVNVASFKRNGNNGGNHNFYSRGQGNQSGYGRGNGNGCGGNKPICQLYGRAGHVALKCYHSFDISFSGNPDGDRGNQQGQANQAYFASSNTVEDAAWYMDSGALNHVTADAHNLSIKAYYTGKEKLIVDNGSKLSISHIRSSVITSHDFQRPLYLNILHVPNITKNLLSISQFTHDNNVVIEFDSNCGLVKDKPLKITLLEGTLKEGLYQLDLRTL